MINKKKKSRPAEDRTANNEYGTREAYTTETLDAKPRASELARVKRDLTSRFQADAEEFSPVWKRCLQNTVTSDPLVPSGGGDIVGCYLDFASSTNFPFRTMSHLIALTGYGQEKIRKIVSVLVELGYMIMAGIESSGAISYRLANPRAAAVLDHVAKEILTAKNKEAAKKRAKRSKKDENVPQENRGDSVAASGSKTNAVPRENTGDVPPKIAGAVPSEIRVQYIENTFDNSKEGGPAFEAGTAGSNSVDRIDAHEAVEAASFTRLYGAPDASGDFAYWCDQAGIDAVEIDLNDAPDIKIIAADDENQPPPLTVTDRYFSGLTHDEALSVEPSERDRVVAELLSGLSLPPALERRVSELLYAGHLTRRKFEQIASISGMEERYVGTR